MRMGVQRIDPGAMSAVLVGQMIKTGFVSENGARSADGTFDVTKWLQNHVAVIRAAGAPLEKRLDAAHDIRLVARSAKFQCTGSGAVPALATLLLADFPADGDLPASRTDADAVRTIQIEGKPLIKNKSLRRAAAEALCQLSEFPACVEEMAAEGMFSDDGLGRLLKALLPRVDWRQPIREWMTGRDQTYILADRLCLLCANAVAHAKGDAFAWASEEAALLLFRHMLSPQDLVDAVAAPLWTAFERNAKERKEKALDQNPAMRAFLARKQPRAVSGPDDRGALLADGREGNGALGPAPLHGDLAEDSSEGEEETPRLKAEFEGSKEIEAQEEREAQSVMRAIAAERAYWEADPTSDAADEQSEPEFTQPYDRTRYRFHLDALNLLDRMVAKMDPGKRDRVFLDLARNGAIAKLLGFMQATPMGLQSGTAPLVLMRQVYTDYAVAEAPALRAPLLADARRATELRQAGNEHFSSGQLQEAVLRYCSALRLDSSDAAALNNLALCWTKMGHLARARRAAEDCLMLDPANAKAWARYGDCFAAARRPQLAQLCYKQAGALGARKDELEPRLNAAIEGLKGHPAWDPAKIPEAYYETARYCSWLQVPAQLLMDQLESARISGEGTMAPWPPQLRGVLHSSKHIASAWIKPRINLAASARAGDAQLRALPPASMEAWVMSWSDTPLMSRETGLVRCLIAICCPTADTEEAKNFSVHFLGVPRAKQVVAAFRAAVNNPKFGAAGGRRVPSSVCLAHRMAPWADEIVRDLRACGVDSVIVETEAEAKRACVENWTRSDGFNNRGHHQIERLRRLTAASRGGASGGGGGGGSRGGSSGGGGAEGERGKAASKKAPPRRKTRG
ncbi:hypothetical protein Rsub_00934 [Raphidocelis subcapitata]|uniref:Uncharacterized protein n=1 Tax=Raphidocelis subcapitata TaxID=307507 RepID=A0A2V0NNY5_9CHLO|nr:hypothetical protein Rsub_00934 [Raphidocelis subcapitata]|eukprot:GBF88222.1 hypothetical protein Rsub_00934 [Raphidocelis subcapitata]